MSVCWFNINLKDIRCQTFLDNIILCMDVVTLSETWGLPPQSLSLTSGQEGHWTKAASVCSVRLQQDQSIRWILCFHPGLSWEWAGWIFTVKMNNGHHNNPTLYRHDLSGGSKKCVFLFDWSKTMAMFVVCFSSNKEKNVFFWLTDCYRAATFYPSFQHWFVHRGKV